jgi:hypothetical protein
MNERYGVQEARIGAGRISMLECRGNVVRKEGHRIEVILPLGLNLGLPLISVPKVPVGFLGNSSGCSEFL